MVRKKDDYALKKRDRVVLVCLTILGVVLTVRLFLVVIAL